MPRKKVPSAIAQKSHRLLMRWWDKALTASFDGEGIPQSVHNHCRRIAKKAGKK